MLPDLSEGLHLAYFSLEVSAKLLLFSGLISLQACVDQSEGLRWWWCWILNDAVPEAGLSGSKVIVSLGNRMGNIRY